VSIKSSNYLKGIIFFVPELALNNFLYWIFRLARYINLFSALRNSLFPSVTRRHHYLNQHWLGWIISCEYIRSLKKS